MNCDKKFFKNVIFHRNAIYVPFGLKASGKKNLFAVLLNL